MIKEMPTASQIYKPLRDPSPSEAAGKHGRCLVADFSQSTDDTGRGILNRNFVARMMGFPTKWCDLLGSRE